MKNVVYKTSDKKIRHALKRQIWHNDFQIKSTYLGLFLFVKVLGYSHPLYIVQIIN